MDRQVTSPTWGPPPPCKQALSAALTLRIGIFFKIGKNIKGAVLVGYADFGKLGHIRKQKIYTSYADIQFLVL